MNNSLRTVTKTVQSLTKNSTFTRPSNALTFHVLRLDMVEVAGSSPVVPTKLTPDNDNLQTFIHRAKPSVLYQYIGYWKILEVSDCANTVQSFSIDCDGPFPNSSDANSKTLTQNKYKAKTSLCGACQ